MQDQRKWSKTFRYLGSLPFYLKLALKDPRLSRGFLLLLDFFLIFGRHFVCILLVYFFTLFTSKYQLFFFYNCDHSTYMVYDAFRKFWPANVFPHIIIITDSTLIYWSFMPKIGKVHCKIIIRLVNCLSHTMWQDLCQPLEVWWTPQVTGGRVGWEATENQVTKYRLCKCHEGKGESNWWRPL